MRLPDLEKYNNDNLIEKRKIVDVPPIERHISIMTDRDKVKFVKTVERVVRGSQEYKQYVAFLRKEVDMTMCSYFTNISKRDGAKVSIEIHHEPFTLYDITLIVVEKWIAEGMKINPILIAEEVMKLHYQGKVGLIPLSLTVHDLVHEGKIFIPLQNVYGDFISFLEEYEPYISQDLQDILEIKLKMSRDVEAQDISILEKKYVYLEIDGMRFPEPLDQVVKK
jgi:hypothetical protein